MNKAMTLPGNELNERTRMTFLQHLKELRDRLVVVAIVLCITTLISTIFAWQIFNILVLPLGGRVPQAISPTETIITYFKVALIAGVVLAMPVIIYQFARFLLPGLMPKERRYLYALVPSASLMFLLGVSFTAFVMLPRMVAFLMSFGSNFVEQQWTLDEYISFVTSLLFWIGLAFETPLVIFFLAKMKIISYQTLVKNMRFAFLIVAIVAAVITPTPDPFNMLIVMVPLLALYGLGVLLARLA